MAASASIAQEATAWVDKVAASTPGSPLRPFSCGCRAATVSVMAALTDDARQPGHQVRHQDQERDHHDDGDQEGGNSLHHLLERHVGNLDQNEEDIAEGRRDHADRQGDHHQHAEVERVDAERLYRQHEDWGEDQDSLHHAHETADEKEEGRHGEEDHRQADVEIQQQHGQFLRDAQTDQQPAVEGGYRDDEHDHRREAHGARQHAYQI